LGSYALVPLGLAGAFWTLKVLTVAATLGSLALVWRIAARRGRDPLGAVLLVGLNPLWLVYGLGGVHNDAFVLLALLAGVAALTAERPFRAGAALATAAALKASGALIVPFALAARGGRERLRLVAGLAVAGAVLLAVSLIVFGPHIPGLGTQGKLVTPLSPPNLLGLALGQGGLTEPVRILIQVALAITIAALLIRTARGADWVVQAGWATLALVLSLSWSMPWYVGWVLPLAALSASRRLRRATLVLTAFLLLCLMPATGWLLADVCNCYPGDTQTGKRHAAEIQRYVR
jgi:hypothetical protein